MKFHPKFTAMFTKYELASIIRASTVYCQNSRDEVDVIIVSTDNVFAELYADNDKSDTVLIMCFRPDGEPISRNRFLRHLHYSQKNAPLRYVEG